MKRIALAPLVVILLLSSTLGLVAESLLHNFRGHFLLNLVRGSVPFSTSRGNETCATSNPTTAEVCNGDDTEHKFTSRDFIPRYTGPATDELTPEQTEIRNSILATRPRTGLSGPFGPWLAVPAVAGPAQALGRACRYGTSLSLRESELVILLTGAKTRSHAEFDIHVGEARQAGIPMATIQSIPRDEAFSLSAVMERVVPLLTTNEGKANDREQAIVRFTAELLETQTVSDETYQQTKENVGGEDSVLVEITSIIGYYTYVAYTLNVFQIPSS